MFCRENEEDSFPFRAVGKGVACKILVSQASRYGSSIPRLREGYYLL